MTHKPDRHPTLIAVAVVVSALLTALIALKAVQQKEHDEIILEWGT